MRGAAEPTPMAADEVAGGARKATKSKLFEFLVHGVQEGLEDLALLSELRRVYL